MLSPYGHGWEMMDAMRRQQELLMQLRALVLPMLHGVINGTSATEIAVQLFDDVIGCNIGMVSTLEGCLISTRAGGGSSVETVDDKSLVRKGSCHVTNNGEKTEERPSVVGQKRRRNDKQSRSVVTHVPHYDGYQWRKYGQKKVNGRRHPRSYYRCTYREQNCFATKTIEQQQEQIDGICGSTAGEEIPKYTVVYYGEHTCKDHNISTLQLPQPVSRIDLQNMEMAQTSSDVQDPETDLDLPALLEVFDNSLIDWEDSWKM